MAIEKATKPETTRETFARWLADGETWIGIFENQDLGHYDIGRRVARPYDVSTWDKAIVGLSGCADHATIGLGWRYVLKLKTKDLDAALAALAENVEVVRG